LQILFKENWRKINSGGQVCEFVIDVKGEGLLEPTKLEEIEPGNKYYMQQVWKPNEFHPTVFSHSVNWSTIEELFKTGRIWRLKQ
jgi:hypothetical protein